MRTETSENNPLLCDPAEGFCGIPQPAAHSHVELKKADKPIRLVYFTDPICSSCWGIEPQLRKLKLEYGQLLEIEYRMGGLLPDWSYNSGGINSPASVASHWDEASRHYDMPIDGDLWLEDPLHSSYPPSIAFKAAQLQDEQKAVLFLRLLREGLFMKKQNITKWEHLEAAARTSALDPEQLKSDLDEKAKVLFEEDLKLAQSLGVRGFPTLFFMDGTGNKEIVYGSRPYAFYEMAVLKLNENATKLEYRKDWESLFTEFGSLTAREYAELSGTPRKESEALLNELTNKNLLHRFSTKNGDIWSKGGEVGG